jgi:hypothetical protein
VSKGPVHAGLYRCEGDIAVTIPQPLHVDGEHMSEASYNEFEDRLVVIRPGRIIIRGRHDVAGRPLLRGDENVAEEVKMRRLACSYIQINTARLNLGERAAEAEIEQKRIKRAIKGEKV